VSRTVIRQRESHALSLTGRLPGRAFSPTIVTRRCHARARPLPRRSGWPSSLPRRRKTKKKRGRSRATTYRGGR